MENVGGVYWIDDSERILKSFLKPLFYRESLRFTQLK